VAVSNCGSSDRGIVQKLRAPSRVTSPRMMAVKREFFIASFVSFMVEGGKVESGKV
jgi:hypothetical protein